VSLSDWLSTGKMGLATWQLYFVAVSLAFFIPISSLSAAIINTFLGNTCFNRGAEI